MAFPMCLTQVGLARPVLKIRHPSLNSVILTWVSTATNFVVQTNSNLATTNWSLANLTVTNIAVTNQGATLSPIPPGKLFFRLQN